MKQVEEEYYKAEEKVSESNISHSQELYAPSPDQPINSMIIPEPVQEAVNSLIKSQHTI